MIYIKVFDADKLNEYPELKLLKGWTYGFVKEASGEIVLCEISRLEEPDCNIGYSYASNDIINKEGFDLIEKSNPGFNCGKTWEEYRSWVIKDILKYREYNETE